MASAQYSERACEILVRHCTMFPICDDCGAECTACRCYQCNEHGIPWKICDRCWNKRAYAQVERHGNWARVNWAELAETWCRLRRAHGYYAPSDQPVGSR